MASLSVSRRTSLVAGPLGTLPRFGETTCAQDAAVATTSSARTSSTNVHNLFMPRALPLERPTLSELALSGPGLANTSLFPPAFLFASLAFSASFSLFPRALTSLLPVCNQTREFIGPHSASREHPCVHRSIATPGRRPWRQFRGTRPARVRNRRARRAVFP